MFKGFIAHQPNFLRFGVIIGFLQFWPKSDVNERDRKFHFGNLFIFIVRRATLKELF